MQIYKPSGNNSAFSFTGNGYAEYITAMQEMIANSRCDLNPDNQQRIIQANSPAEYIGTNAKRGVLLIHGLYDSPNTMSSLYQHYCREDTLVRSLLLPGHGTVPGDLLHVTLEDWLSACVFAIESFSQQVSDLTVIGFSTGASLALYQALLGMPITRLILITPAIGLITQLADYVELHKLVSWAWSRAGWVTQTEQQDYAKYQSYTFNSVHQVNRLVKNIQSFHQDCACPILMVTTTEDEILKTHTSHHYFLQQPHPDNQLLVFSKHPPMLHEEQVTWVNSTNMQQKILDYSHACLPVAPDHAHYGKAGDFRDYQHYHTLWGRHFPHQADKEIYYGAVNPHNLKQYRLCRLRYNPQFDLMVNAFDQFMQLNSRVKPVSNRISK